MELSFSIMSLSISWKKLLNLDVKGLVKISKFIKIILKHFDTGSESTNFEKLNANDVYVLKTTETRCGRKVVQPVRYRNDGK